VLPTEKSLVISFWTFFQIFGQPRRIRKNRKPPKMFVDAGVYSYLSKVNLEFSYSSPLTNSSEIFSELVLAKTLFFSVLEKKIT